jgi:hypothetical protein
MKKLTSMDYLSLGTLFPISPEGRSVAVCLPCVPLRLGLGICRFVGAGARPGMSAILPSARIAQSEALRIDARELMRSPSRRALLCAGNP